jgi:hypothetical protein
MHGRGAFWEVAENWAKAQPSKVPIPWDTYKALAVNQQFIKHIKHCTYINT